jgi:hypothetical protein
MAEVLTCREVASADWAGIAARFADLTYEQTRAYSLAAARRIGARSRFLALWTAEGELAAACAVRIKSVPGLGRGIAWCPGGPLMRPRRDDGAAAEAETARLVAVLGALRACLAGGAGHVLRLRPSGLLFAPAESVEFAARTAGFQPAARPGPYRSFAIDAQADEAALMASMNGKWRTELRAALKAGLSVETGTGPAIETRFMAIYDAVKVAKGFDPEIPPGFHFALAGDDHQVETMIATHGGADVAGIVTVRCAASTTYAFGATGAAGRPLRAGYLLQWEAIRRARNQGSLWYDLGGVDFRANPDVARFKERMGGPAIGAAVWQALPQGPLAHAGAGMILGLEALRFRARGR